MSMFNRAASRLRKQRKADELFHTSIGDISVYPDAIRRGEEVQPITANTRVSVEYGGGKSTDIAAHVTLVVDGSGFHWRQRFVARASKKADKIAEIVNTRAAIAAQNQQ